jgi:hypothetical protein
MEGTTKNRAAFEALSKSINALTRNGQQLNPMIIVSRGNEFILYMNTKSGKSVTRMSDPNLVLLFGQGTWLLMENHLWILINELSEVLNDEIHFLDRKKDGWVQVYVPTSNRMLNLRLFSYSSRFKLWRASLFSDRLKVLRDKLKSLT